MKHNKDCGYEPRTFQFGLKTLFIVTFFVAVFCGAVVTQGLLAGVVEMLLLGAFLGYWFRKWLLAVVCFVVLLVGYFCFSVVDSYGGLQQAKCIDNMKEISTTIFAYTISMDEYPPPYIADESGKPMHSWRVLILPMLGYQNLYDQYNFDEPWNGPNNRKLAKECPDVFQCPSERIGGRRPSAETSYVAVIGPETIWPGDKAVKRTDIVNTTRTIVLVEVANSGINWMEPRDLHIDEIAASIDTGKRCISSQHPYFVTVSFADGHVESVSARKVDAFVLQHASVAAEDAP